MDEGRSAHGLGSAAVAFKSVRLPTGNGFPENEGRTGQAAAAGHRPAELAAILGPIALRTGTRILYAGIRLHAGCQLNLPDSRPLCLSGVSALLPFSAMLRNPCL